MQQQVQVLVVGAGPVGLTMAAELARYGVPVRIIDKSAGRTDKSGALVMWSRTLELLDRMGDHGWQRAPMTISALPTEVRRRPWCSREANKD